MEWSRNPDPFLRFNERTVKDQSGCWLWQGRLNARGYATFKINGQNVGVHRWAYETYRGTIPDNLVLDHLCKVKSCVNPDHLEVVTLEENNRRARRTHCLRAQHPLTEENIIILSGNRACRLCHQARSAKYRERSDQARQRTRAAKHATKTFLVVSSNESDIDPLMQELEKLKQNGLILNFFQYEPSL